MKVSVESRWLLEFLAGWSMKEAGNRILMLGSLGPGARLAWRHAHLAYAVFVCCRLSASSLPPTRCSGRYGNSDSVNIDIYSQ